MNIVKREIVKNNKIMRCYFIALVLKAKLIEQKTKNKEIDFIYNNCDVESFIFNGKLRLII